MTFSTNEQVQLEQEQREHNLAEVTAVATYTRHPGDDAQAAQSIMGALPWSSDQCSDFIEQHGQRLREQAEGLVAEANALGITPQEAMVLKASATASGIITQEAEMQVFLRHLLSIAGLGEQETTDLVRAAGVEMPVAPESRDYPAWHLDMPPGASRQQQAQVYRLAQANAMIHIALSQKQQLGATKN